MRQEWGQQVVRIRHSLGGNVQHGAEASRIVLDLPRFSGGNVLVDVADHAHGFAQRVLLTMILNQRTDRVERGLGFAQQSAILISHFVLVERRNLTEVLVHQVGHTVDEVAPGSGKLLVVVAHELSPCEVGIGAFRTGHGNVVAHGVHRVAGENILHINDNAAGRRELLAFHGHELGSHNLLRHVQRAQLARFAALGSLAVVAEHFGRPDLGVERDVVFAHEVVARGFRVVPPCAPRFRVSLAASPFDGCRQVADHGVEPHVQLLVRIVDPAGNRNRNAPVDVTRDGTRLDFLEQTDGEVDDVGAPAFAGLQPCEIGFGERRQVEEEVFGFLKTRGFAVDFGNGVEKLVWVEFVAAGVALVAAGAVGTADRTGAFDVTVRQGAAGGRRDGDLLGALIDVAVGEALLEQFLHHLLVIAGGGAREQVVAQAKIAQILGNHAVVTVGELLCADALLVGFHQDRGAVLVGARHHQHVIALHALVARVHVGGHAEAGDVTDMTGAVSIRPSNIHQNMTHGA